MPGSSRNIRLLVNGERLEVKLLSLERDAVSFIIDGRRYDVEYEAGVPSGKGAARSSGGAPTKSSGANAELSGRSRTIVAPIPGVVAAVLVQPGAAVQQSEILIRLDAMKMENNLLSPQAGTVRAVLVKVGEEVRDGQVLIELDT